MKKLLPLLLALAMPLSSCAAGAAEAPPPAQTEPVTTTTAPAAEATEPAPAASEPPAGRDTADSAVFTPDAPLSIEETIDAYFRELYRSYVTMQPVDITSILWLEERAVKNSVVWGEMLAMRRRLIYENNFCYVETERLPYAIGYIDEASLSDERLEIWSETRPAREGEQYRHFVVTGEAGRAYPPFLALNAQHTIRLMQIDGVWKITLHYFPGSVRKWVRNGVLTAPGEEDMLRALTREFAGADSAPVSDLPGTLYDPWAAVDYALLYTESANPGQYHAGEWLGNCQNFISQCVSAGFGGKMAAGWYAGGGGGSPAWENVRYFWDWLAESGEAQGREIAGVPELREGDLIQTEGGPYGKWGADPPGTYSHCLLVADAGTLLLAQNTPACFILYSDLVNVNTRMIRPMTLIE